MSTKQYRDNVNNTLSSLTGHCQVIAPVSSR